jgi:TolB protein
MGALVRWGLGMSCVLCLVSLGSGVRRWALGVRRWVVGVRRWALGVGRWGRGMSFVLCLVSLGSGVRRSALGPAGSCVGRRGCGLQSAYRFLAAASGAAFRHSSPTFGNIREIAYAESMRRHLGLLLFLFAAGCGGTGTNAPVGTEHSIPVGLVSAQYQGGTEVKPAIVGQSASIVVTGVDSANFTQVTLNPTNSLLATKLAFNNRDEVWFMDPDGGNRHQVTSYGGAAASFSTTPSWGPGGAKITFDQLDPVSGYPQIFTANSNGSGVTRLTSNSPGNFSPVYSPSGATIAFTLMIGVLNQVFVMNSNGSSPVKLSDGTGEDRFPAFSPDGTKIYFAHKDSTSSYYNLCSVPAGGGATVVALNLGTITTSPFHVSFQPDGRTIALDFNSAIQLGTLNSGQTTTLSSPPSGQADSQPSFSPDGSSIVFERSGTGFSQIMKMSSDGSNVVNLTPSTVTTAHSPSWSPFPGKRLLVGAGGVLGTTASGFVIAQNGDQMTSFVKFSATTPTTSKITVVSPGGNATNVVCQLSADSITDLRFINGLYAVPTLISTPARGALVSFNSSTGQVSLVVPYTSTKGAIKRGSSLVFEGTYPAVYDGNGVNLAPSGARHITIDTRRGSGAPKIER